MAVAGVDGAGPLEDRPQLHVREIRRNRERCRFIEVRERRRMAIDLRAGGANMLDIGLRLAADPEINSRGIAHPSGYGWQNYVNGKSTSEKVLASSVSRDIREGMKVLSAYEGDSAAEWREMELLRMDQAQQAIMPFVLRGQQWHVLRHIQLSEQRMKLLGLDQTNQGDDPVQVGALSPDGVNPAIQPAWTPDMFASMFEILIEAGAQDGESTAAALDQIRAVEADADVVDAEVVSDSADGE